MAMKHCYVIAQALSVAHARISEGVSLSMHSFYTYCDNGFGTGQLQMEYKSAISDG